MKYVIYQQAARGYGRISRGIKLMKVINDIENSSGIIFSGDSLIDSFFLPKDVNLIKLPQIFKGLNKNYASKNNAFTLNDCLKERARIIKQTIINFNPDIFFVDNNPTGVLDELKELIIWIKNHNLKTKIIFIVRDIIDSPGKTIKEWNKYGVYEFLERYYDSIFVFGSQIVFDFCKEYKLSENLRKKVVYCNYFSSDYFLKSNIQKINKIDILITVGGGIDGFNLISSFLKIYKKEKWEFKVVIILGEQLPVEDKEKLIKQIPHNVTTLDFTLSIVDYYIKSNLVICRGGYNTITELIALNKHPLVIPRKSPTKEQHIRAKQLKNMSLISLIDLNKKDEFKSMILSNLKSLKANRPNIKFNLKEIIEKNLNEIMKTELIK